MTSTTVRKSRYDNSFAAVITAAGGLGSVIWSSVRSGIELNTLVAGNFSVRPSALVAVTATGLPSSRYSAVARVFIRISQPQLRSVLAHASHNCPGPRRG